MTRAMDESTEVLRTPASAAPTLGLNRRGLIAAVGTGLAASQLIAGADRAEAATRKDPRSDLHAANKQLVARFLREMASGDAREVLAAHCQPDCRWELYHPLNGMSGLDEVAAKFWLPLRTAFPDYEQRIACGIAGDYEGRTQVSTLGYLMGNFHEPWLGIPPHGVLAFMRFGFNAIVRDGRIAKAYVQFDTIDVMRQAGFYPFREMPGSPEAWPFPPCDTGASLKLHDGVRGAKSLRIIREMQQGLLKPSEIKELAPKGGRHSPHWHVNMNWYGAAGIGSMRGRANYRNHHGSLFLQAFPDRQGFARDGGVPEDAPGHYVRLGDGQYAVTGGWPSLHATHLGPEWLGLPPTGRRVEMRVADWYRLDDDDKIIDNWVMFDMAHILSQMGYDLFHDLQFRVKRAKDRVPLF
jgi:predicted ester cyclase